MVEFSGNFICPRCGNPGYIERRYVDRHIYLYCRHIWYEGKKRKERKCYLGAEKYVYVEPFQGLGLSGLFDKERFKRYVETLIYKLTEEELEWLAEVVKKRLEVVKVKSTSMDGGG
jgi:DUF1365 family protein